MDGSVYKLLLLAIVYYNSLQQSSNTLWMAKGLRVEIKEILHVANIYRYGLLCLENGCTWNMYMRNWQNITCFGIRHGPSAVEHFHVLMLKCSSWTVKMSCWKPRPRSSIFWTFPGGMYIYESWPKKKAAWRKVNLLEARYWMTALQLAQVEVGEDLLDKFLDFRHFFTEEKRCAHQHKHIWAMLTAEKVHSCKMCANTL